MNFNRIVIVGNLTRDPETRALPSGQNVASFSVATNRIWNDPSGNRQEATEFHNVVAFGKLADICSRYLNKGRLVLIEGRIQTRSWQDQDGNKRYRTEIVTDNMQMGPRINTGSGPTTSQPKSQENLPSQENIPIIDSEEPIEENKQEKVDVKDIPF